MSTRGADAESQRLSGRDGRDRVIVVLALGWFFTLGMRFLVPAVLPQIKTDFGMDNTTAGVAVTAIWGGYALMQFPAGALIDRVGERRLLTVSLIAAGVSVLVLAASPTTVAFVAGCGLFGLATGLFGPARGTTLSRTFPDSEGRAFGLTLAAGSVGSALLPLLAGLLVGPFGWQVSVAFTAPGFLLVGVATWLVVRDRRARSDEDEASGGLSVGALLDVFERAEVVVPVAAITLLLFGLEGITAFLPTYLHDVKGLSPAVSSGVFALFFVGGAIWQFAAGNLSDRYSERLVLVGFTGFSVLVLLGLPFVNGLPALAVVVFLLGARNGISPISNAYIISVLPDRIQGAAWGFIRTVFFLLGSTGSIVVGSLADRGYFVAAFFGIAALTAVAAALYLRLPDRRAIRGTD